MVSISHLSIARAVMVEVPAGDVVNAAAVHRRHSLLERLDVALEEPDVANGLTSRKNPIRLDL